MLFGIIPLSVVRPLMSFCLDITTELDISEFGDTSILKEIDKIASKESTSKPKGKRGRPRKK